MIFKVQELFVFYKCHKLLCGCKCNSSYIVGSGTTSQYETGSVTSDATANDSRLHGVPGAGVLRSQRPRRLQRPGARMIQAEPAPVLAAGPAAVGVVILNISG